MAKKEFKSELVDLIDILEESPKGNWAKVISKMSWNDEVPVIDIRNIDMSTIDSEKPLLGKGISLSDSACNRLVRVLIEEGYITKDELREYLDSVDSMFKKNKKLYIKKVKR